LHCGETDDTCPVRRPLRSTIDALGEPIGFAAMTAAKLGRMWLGYDRGTTHAQRTWVLVLHLALVGAALSGAGFGLVKLWDLRLGPVLLALATATSS
jgi:hypothetical protein